MKYMNLLNDPFNPIFNWLIFFLLNINKYIK